MGWDTGWCRSPKAKKGRYSRGWSPNSFKKQAPRQWVGIFVPVVVLPRCGLLLVGGHSSLSSPCALTLGYAAIGWLDDWQILRHKSNKGISPRMKLALQMGFGALFCLWLARINRVISQPSLYPLVLPP